MSEVKLLGNVAQKLNALLTADRSEDEWEPYDNPYSPSASTYQTVPAQTSARKAAEGADSGGYDCMHMKTMPDTLKNYLSLFDPVDSIKYIWYCNDHEAGTLARGVALLLDLVLASGLTLAAYATYLRIRFPNRPNTLPPIAPTGLDAKVKNKDTTVENKEVFLKLIRDGAEAVLILKGLPLDSPPKPKNIIEALKQQVRKFLAGDTLIPNPLFDIVSLGKDKRYGAAADEANKVAKSLESEGRSLEAGKAKLLGGYYSKLDPLAPQSEAMFLFFEADKLFQKARQEEAKNHIGALAGTAGRNFCETMFEDLREQLEAVEDPDKERDAETRKNLANIPFDSMLATLGDIFESKDPRAEYKRFRDEGGIEFVMDKMRASAKTDTSTGEETIAGRSNEPSYYNEWTRVKAANDEAARIASACGGDFRELQKEADSITSKTLNETKDWNLAAALYLKASSVKGINDLHKSILLIGAGDSLSNAGRFTEARRHFESVLNIFAGKQNAAMSTESLNVSYAKSGIDKITVITGQGLGEEAAKLASLHDMRELFGMEGTREESIRSVYTRINKVPPIEVVDSLARISLRWAEVAEQSNVPSFNARRAYEVVIEYYKTYGHEPGHPGNMAQAAIARLQTASTVEPGVLRARAHKATGPKIDQNVVRRAAMGGEEAIEYLMREVQKEDPNMTISGLAEILAARGTEKAAAELKRLGLEGVERFERGQLARALKGNHGAGGRGKEEDRRGEKGPRGK